MADSVTLALVRVPNLQLLNSQTEMDEEEKAAGKKDPMEVRIIPILSFFPHFHR